MSWMIGVQGNVSSELRNRITSLLPSKYIQATTKNLAVFGGGLPETTCSEKAPEDSHGFIICGIGIKTINDHAKFMEPGDWQNITKGNIEEIRKLNGHFAGIKWDPTCTVLFTDVLGLREIYLTKLADVILFSTRLDWLAKLRRDTHIDFDQFGSVWLSFNQLSHTSVISNIERMGPGCIAFLNNRKIKFNRQPWLPDMSQQSSPNQAIEKIKKFALFPLHHNQKISLGLSGGIDSRVLLAILSSQPNENWSLHTFGDPDHPDGLVARDIANKFKLNLIIVNTKLPPVDECIEVMKNHLGQNTVHIPASEIMRLRWYIPLYHQQKIVIDGGFGEIARRQYLNRLLFLGKKSLLHKDTKLISKYLRYYRAGIFNYETHHIMEKGVSQQLDQYIKSLPDINELGMENWSDLLMIHSRLANWNGYDQACIDGLTINYMPYAQKELLNEVLTLPIKLRKNGRLWRKIIKEFQPNLTQFPLVKGSIVYPFRLSKMGTMVWTFARQKMRMYYKDRESVILIDHLSEFIRDLIHSKDVKSFPHYDYAAIKEMVDNYFAGEKRYAKNIDWWLAFELWRRSLL